MDGASNKILEDCFLRTLVDPRSTNVPVTKPTIEKSQLKTELQILRLSDNSKEAVMETLKYIHGSDFKFDDISKYKDKGTRIQKGYWEERGNLVIQGTSDYSNVQKSGCNVIDRFRILNISKLESYGFHKNHCIEALDYCKGDVDDSLILLYFKYFPNSINAATLDNLYLRTDDKEILEFRNDEIAALQSIYDESFTIKEKNKIWQLKLKIDHLLLFSPSEQKKQKLLQDEVRKIQANTTNKPVERCRNFARGLHCKYGERCKFSHTMENPSSNSSDLNALDLNWFFIEIRFPMTCRYPYEAPLIFFKTTCPDFPTKLCLQITRRLIKEAKNAAEICMPSIYTISNLLLQMDDDFKNFLKTDQYHFLDPKLSIFYEPPEDSITNNLSNKELLPTHYEKGTINSSDRSLLSGEQLSKDNMNLMKKFMSKQTHQTYLKMLSIRKKLPAWEMMTSILNLIEFNQTVVICGETGCGKSTQIPQFILDDWLLTLSKTNNSGKSKHVEIICTQPRRISAIGVAERVADERIEKMGNTIGYQIRLENKISTATRLTFCTTGILLRRLQSDPMLKSISHVIVDEVHERSEESDFLLMILKQLLQKRSDFRVILMSATLNAHLFSKYFNDAPILEIPGRTYPVQQFFLEEILELSGFVLEADSQFCRRLNKRDQNEILNELEYSDVKVATGSEPPQSIKDENLLLADIYARYLEYSRATCKTLFLMDPLKINPDLIETILNYVCFGEHEWPKDGAILIFLPGLAEIQSLYDSLYDSSVFSPRVGKFIIVPLHSSLSNEEQGLVFRRPPPGKRKIVLTTNIAETSVTIDDCVFVIDSGQMKEKRFDANRNMESLDLVWISKANAQQRKGRAGRVMPGIAIHLFTKHRYQYNMIGQPIPEIQRVPLEQLLLRIKTIGIFANKNIMDVIANIIEPPSEDNVYSAVQRLIDVGAFDEYENLTALGHHLAALPVDVRIGKLMLYGAIFQCVDSILTIAACLSYKSPFVSPFNKRTEADAKKKEFSISNSDHLTVLRAYKRWIDVSKRSKYAARCYADENYLSTKTLETLIEIKQQFLELLVSIGFIPGDVFKGRAACKDNILEISGAQMNVNGDNNRLLSALLCAALYPNVVKVMTPEKSFVQSAGGAIPREPLPSELRFKTYQDGYVFIHPSSINSTVGNFTSPFLVFQEKVKTSKIFIRECTMIPLLPLVLFSGTNLNIELHGGNFIILLENGWILVQAASHEVAEMLKCLRNELAKLLEEKIGDPCLNLLNHDNGKKIISTIVMLISKE